jgi:hypothetical protein
MYASTGRVPFTPSHAAAVLPLLRIRVGGKALPPSALVCGSLAPDVPYYVPTPLGGMSTHSIGAAIGVDVLLAAGVWLLWHGLLARPALAGAPREVRARLRGVPIGLRTQVRGPAEIVALYVAFSLGAVTHVVWDSFTHPHRWGTDHIDALNDVYLDRPLSHWAQLASTALGALALCAYGFVRWRARSGTDAIALKPLGAGAVAAWLGVAAAACAGAVAGVLEQRSGGTSHGLNYMMLTRSISAAAAAAIAVSAMWHAVNRADVAA